MDILKYIVVLLLYCKTIKSQISTFTNPVLDILIWETAIIRIHGSYYLIYADNAANELRILKSPFLTDFRNAEIGVVYRRPAGYSYFYPASILEYQNDLYLYFHMQTIAGEPWQMFVVKAHDSRNPMGMWNAPVRVLDSVWNINSKFGDTFQINGQLYFVWTSSTATNPDYPLYIVKMRNPVEVVEPVVLLQEPTEGWTCGLHTPSFIYNRDKVYMIVNECAPNTTTGFLGYMSTEIGLDPLNPSNWEIGTGPVFQGSEDEDVYDIRFPEFTTSPDGTETWMVYSARGNISSQRIRIDKVVWNTTTGSPIFPVAKANGYQQQLPSGEPSKYFNPVSRDLTTYAESPNVYCVGDDYYTVLRLQDNSNELVVLKYDKLFDYSNAEKSVVYTAAEGLSVNGGRMFEISGEVYMSFHTHSASQGFWLYLSKAENKSNLMESWSTPIRLLDGVLNGQGFHASVLYQNNQFYLIWGHPNNDSSHDTYIARMSSPTEVTEPIVLLKEPKQNWECYTTCTTNYPSVIYHQNIAFVFFSASHPNHADASISYMSIENGKDPLDVINWYTAPGPVFRRNDAENVYAVGKAWFTTSPDGSEDWMMYQASDNSSDIQGSRSFKIQKITWDKETGHPVFPKALGYKHSLAIPSTFVYFTNPITDDTSENPGIIRVGYFYYMVLSTEGSSDMVLLKSGKLENFRNAEKKIVYSVPDGFSISGSSKLHKVDDQLYIYFSIQEQNSISKMFVLQAQDPFNPMGVWHTNNLIQLAPAWNLPAFQSTLLEHDGNFYLVWITPNPASGFNSIYIAKMKNATYALEPFNLIRHPTELWECDGGCSNQAPYFVYNEGTAYMVHSVGAVCKAGNALTYMSIGKDKDPLNSVNWVKAEGKVFTENVDESIFCPAHATFAMSPDQNETWMVYHATNSPHVDAVKTAHIEKITWNKDTGEPIFPEPHGLHHEQLVPCKNYNKN